MEEIPRSTGRKRQRDEDVEPEKEEADETLSLENNLSFSDTSIALRIMHAQFPNIKKVTIQPFILRSQLYSSVQDRTQVDRELESLRRDKVLRIFKLNTGQDDHAIMFMDDYLNQIETALKRMETKNRDDTAVFEWFKTYVIASKLDDCIEHQELVTNGVILHNINKRYHLIEIAYNGQLQGIIRNPSIGTIQDEAERLYHSYQRISSSVILLRFGMVIIPFLGSDDDAEAPFEVCSLLSFGGKVKDEHITLLINAGLLTRQLIDSNMYWFAIPYIGSLLKGLSQGRRELLSFLNRRKYKEMLLAPLEKKRLRLSPLDMRFHLRDLIGSGRLKTINTPTGVVVRVSKD